MYEDNMPVCQRCMMMNSTETRYCYHCGWRIHPYSGVRGDTPKEFWMKYDDDE